MISMLGFLFSDTHCRTVEFECSKLNLIRAIRQIGREHITSENTSKLLKLANFTDKVEYMLEPQMSTVLQNKKKKEREIGTKKKKSKN